MNNSPRRTLFSSSRWSRGHAPAALLPVRCTPCSFRGCPLNRAEYNRYCLVAIGVMLFGVGYWAWWRILLPKVFRYEFVPYKETLEDGTVVIVVRVLRFTCVNKTKQSTI